MIEISATDGYPMTDINGKIIVVDPKRWSRMRVGLKDTLKPTGEAKSAGEIMAEVTGDSKHIKLGPDDGDMLG